MFAKVVTTKKGMVRLSAQRHGIGWRVTATMQHLGITHTSYDKDIDVAAKVAISHLLNDY